MRYSIYALLMLKSMQGVLYAKQLAHMVAADCQRMRAEC